MNSVMDEIRSAAKRYRDKLKEDKKEIRLNTKKYEKQNKKIRKMKKDYEKNIRQ